MKEEKMRLIDADAIPWDVDGVGFIPVIGKDEIDAMPEAVVRCKDCVNRGWENECPLFESAYITGGGDEGSNFYCAWGERREGE